MPSRRKSMKAKIKRTDQSPAAPVATKAPESVREQDNAGHDRPTKHHTIMNHPPLPTSFELAQIAALMHGESSPFDPQSLAAKALNLWNACDHELTSARSARGLGLSPDFWDRHDLRGLGLEIVSRGPPPCPEEWPCSFDDVLRLLMPKLRTKGDRYAKLRAFIKYATAHSKTQATPQTRNASLERDESGPDQNAEVTIDEIEAVFKELKQQGFENREERITFWNAFWNWSRDDKMFKTSDQRSLAAKSRWKKVEDAKGKTVEGLAVDKPSPGKK